METLKPIEVSEYYISRVQSGLINYFWDNIFGEIFKILKNNAVLNSKDALLNAIKSGRIWYEKGAFRSDKRFSNSISKTLEKMGATFKGGAYYIKESAIPVEYIQALGIEKTIAAAKGNAIARFLSGLAFSKIDLKPFIESAVDFMFRKLEVDIIKSAQDNKIPVIELGIVQPDVRLPRAKTKKVDKYWKDYDKAAAKLREAIKKADKRGEDTTELKEVLSELNKNAFDNAPQLDVSIDDVKLDEKSKKIAEDYTYNMQYWVKKWEAKNIVKMRKDILQMVQEGARVPRIAEYFEKRWKIAKDKALFLADNESHLASSVIKATEYQMMGCPGYKWGRSSSREKRKLHEKYYGQYFTWEDKPILDERLGIRGYPRQIWNCKCHMLIVPPSLSELVNKRMEINNGFFRRIKNSKQRNYNSWRYRRLGEGQAL